MLATALARRRRRGGCWRSTTAAAASPSYDRNPDNYSLPVELADLQAVIAACDAQPAVFIGSSRGGLLTMLLAAQRPTAIAGAILNDIGPVIEPRA